MIRLLKYCSVAAVVIGSVWFVMSCGTTLSGDMCGGRRMEPGDVCVSSGGSKSTYEEKVAAKEGGPAGMKLAGGIFVVGVGLNILSELLPILAERKRQAPKA